LYLGQYIQVCTSTYKYDQIGMIWSRVVGFQMRVFCPAALETVESSVS
jgi:hypothetical protein